MTGEPGRKRIGVALGGGGARGLAHNPTHRATLRICGTYR